MFEKKNRFEISITGLSEDIIDFVFERDIYYSEHKTKFWSSFYHTCSETIQNLIDLSDKQLNIIYREYKRENRGLGE